MPFLGADLLHGYAWGLRYSLLQFSMGCAIYPIVIVELVVVNSPPHDSFGLVYTVKPCDLEVLYWFL